MTSFRINTATYNTNSLSDLGASLASFINYFSGINLTSQYANINTITGNAINVNNIYFNTLNQYRLTWDPSQPLTVPLTGARNRFIVNLTGTSLVPGGVSNVITAINPDITNETIILTNMTDCSDIPQTFSNTGHPFPAFYSFNITGGRVSVQMINNGNLALTSTGTFTFDVLNFN